MRLNRYLASCGLGSRRECEQLIRDGLVTINEKPVSEPYVRVALGQDVVKVSGEGVKPPTRHLYLMMNKPKGYLTTTTDPEGRRTVMSLLPKSPDRLFPVGRLDQDSEGLLLFTTDGALAQQLAHPRYGIPRFYRVELATPFPSFRLKELQKGAQDRGEHLCVTRARLCGRGKKSKRVEVVLYTGKKRELRRLFAALGFPVIRILRYGFGSLRLGDLEPGATRVVSPDELVALRKTVERG